MRTTLSLIVLIIIAAGCKPHTTHHGDSPLMQRIKLSTAPTISRQPGIQLDPSRYHKVVWTDPHREFFVTKRTPKITRYPCSSCHDGRNKVRDPRLVALTHGQIEVRHGKGNMLSCTSCHNATKPDRLNAANETTVSFDQSYLTCASCHNARGKDWAGGAHGKRISNWLGLRVVKSCTDCHNPHRPGFAKRWPSTYFKPSKR